MSLGPSGFLTHLRLQGRAQARNRQSLLYGLGLPLFFLLGFAALFQGSEPPLLDHLGQLIALTLLGGACFGLPVALVAEREAGVWRRHRLAPVSIFWMLAPVLLVRAFWVTVGVVIQLALAMGVWGAPAPADPLSLGLAYGLVLAVFLALGLVVASLADTVPAVQAIGQALFLPMVILGGVGVPLVALPEWAQRFSAFWPGRYAVELLQSAWLGQAPAQGLSIPLVALTAMGASALAVGLWRFRWDPLARPTARERAASAVALVPWLILGATVGQREAWRPPVFPEAYASLTEADIASIRYDDLPGDDEFVTPIGPSDLVARPGLRDALTLLASWPEARQGDSEKEIRALVSVAALADGAQDVTERDYGRAVYLYLRSHYGRGELRRVLAWLVFHPDRGEVRTAAPELGIHRRASEALVRQRTALYARKYLGRIEGVLKD